MILLALPIQSQCLLCWTVICWMSMEPRSSSSQIRETVCSSICRATCQISLFPLLSLQSVSSEGWLIQFGNIFIYYKKCLVNRPRFGLKFQSKVQIVSLTSITLPCSHSVWICIFLLHAKTFLKENWSTCTKYWRYFSLILKGAAAWWHRQPLI